MMSEKTFTPGPWFVAKSGMFLVCTLSPAVSVYADQMVRTEAEHDARLIAAAPELLEALRNMDESMCRGFDTRADRDFGRKALVAARAAIAKATGSQS